MPELLFARRSSGDGGGRAAWLSPSVHALERALRGLQAVELVDGRTQLIHALLDLFELFFQKVSHV